MFSFERTLVETLYFEEAFTIEEVKTRLDAMTYIYDPNLNKDASPTSFTEFENLRKDIYKLHFNVLKMKKEVEQWIGIEKVNEEKANEDRDACTNDACINDHNYDSDDFKKNKRQRCSEDDEKKPIILYGVDAIMKKMGLDVRPRLLITDASADLDNLSSRLIGHVQWLDGPQKWKKLCTLCESVNMVMGTSCNASKFLCVNAEGAPELMESRRVCNAKGKHIGGTGFYDLTCQDIVK